MKAHKIVIHTLQFMKFYLLDYYNKNKSLLKLMMYLLIVVV